MYYINNTPFKEQKGQKDKKEQKPITFTQGRKSVGNYSCKIQLNENNYHIDTPAGFKNIRLFPHQQANVAAMLDLEKHCANLKEIWNVRGNNIKIKFQTSAGLLSEKFGAGKTIMILALYLHQPMPEQEHMFFSIKNERRGSNHQMFTIKKTFHANSVLKPMLVFVAASVVLQWEKTIRDFTCLKVFTISGVRQLNKWYEMVQNKQINEYDIVLIKNGQITGKTYIKGYVEPKNRGTSRKIVNMVANMSRTVCWSRVVFDDYDIIKLPNECGHINARFTWFISATSLYSSRSNINVIHRLPSTYDNLNHHNITMKRFCSGVFLEGAGNIRCLPKYTEESIAMCKPKFYAYPIINKNKQLMGMIGELAGNKAVEIMEMLNGDAIETAAERAGIKTDSVGDIFKKVLGDQYNVYNSSVETEQFARSLNIDDILMMDKPPEGEVYWQKHFYVKKPVNYNYLDMKSKIDNVIEKCQNDKKTSGVAINRVKENIKENECPICCTELDDEDIFIMKCCGKILCSECGKQGTNTRRLGKRIMCRCPNCRKDIPFTDFIFLGEDFELDKITNDEIEISEYCKDQKEKYEEKEEKNRVPEIDVKNTTKIDAVIGLIRGYNVKGRVECDLNIPGMLTGMGEKPVAPQNKRKFIIFARHDETLHKLENEMKKQKIVCKRLGGTAAQLHADCVEFEDSYEGNNILLINGEKYSSGRNLQSATDLIFLHKIIESNIEAQIVGRVQRIGRKYEAHIHYMMYENEMRHGNFTMK